MRGQLSNEANRGVAQLASASGLGPEGPVFESLYPDRQKKRPEFGRFFVITDQSLPVNGRIIRYGTGLIPKAGTQQVEKQVIFRDIHKKSFCV